MWLAIAGTVGLAVLVSVVLHIKTANIIIVPALFLAVRWYMLSSTELMVDKSGVRVGDVGVPWASIAQLVVFEPEPQARNGEAWVGVQLRPDADLPPAAASTHAGAVNTRQVYGPVRTDKLDVDRMTAKARHYAPAVEVTQRQGQPAGVAVVPPAGMP